MNDINQQKSFDDVVQSETNSPVAAPYSSLIHVICRRYWIVLAGTAACLLVALIYLVFATPVYTSTSQIYVEQSAPRIMVEEEGVMTQSKNYLYTQATLLRARPILAEAVNKLNIENMKTFQKTSSPFDYLKNNLNISVGKKDDIINVSFDSPYPAEAAQVVNALVDSYITNLTSHKRIKSSDVLKLLRKDKAQREEELKNNLEMLKNFTQQNGTLSFENDKGNIVVQRLARLSDASTEAKLETIEAKSAYDTINAMLNDTVKVRQLFEAQHNSGRYSLSVEVTQLRNELHQLQGRLQSVMLEGTADCPVALNIRSRIAQVQHRLTEHENQFAQACRTAAIQRWISAQQVEAEITSSLEKQKKLALDLNSRAAEYAVLKSNLERSEDDCEQLNSRIKEINVTEDTGALNISILEVARPTNKPAQPRKARIMGIALALGLMLGVVLALLFEWMDQKLRSTDEIFNILAAPVLGAIPSMGDESNKTKRAMKVLLDSSSMVAEAYRSIRTALYFGLPREKARTLLITSPTPSEGKTTLVTNLAVSMAQAGQRTLVVDADFRRPMLHKLFKVNQQPGLAGVLNDNNTLEQAVQNTDIENLHILSCGPIVQNPSELLSGPVFSDILNQLKNNYDRILIDSPPIMQVSDARILAAVCDVTLLVLHAEKSTRKTVAQARDYLFGVGAKIFGAVLNDVPLRKGRYGYYDNYGYNGYKQSYSYTNTQPADNQQDADNLGQGEKIQNKSRIVEVVSKGTPPKSQKVTVNTTDTQNQKPENS